MQNETTWHIVPTQTPNIIRHCSKCNRKMPYYCSEKFRANANQSRVDIWLIYKCTKCDNTWKLSLYKGVRPHELPTGLFDKFVNNDAALAWQYAFDRNFLKQHGCTVDYTNVGYTVKVTNEQGWETPVHVHVESQYSFDLKLSVLLARILDTSVGQIKRLADMGHISASPEINIMKHRIKANQCITVIIGLSQPTNSCQVACYFDAKSKNV